MNDDLFYKLTKEQLFNGANLSVANGEAHLMCAEEMAKLNQFGLANSHLILGVEEFIKATLLFAAFLNIKIDDKIRPYFGDHKAKHKAGELMDIPYQKVSSIINLIELFTNASKKKFSIAKFLNVIEDLGDDTNYQDWWKNANNRKNDGFYVGYENDWKYPQQITSKEFEKSKRAIKGISKIMQLSKSLKIEDHKIYHPFIN